MWAQYADGHRSVCLWFDRARLEESFSVTFAGRGLRLSGSVEYEDGIPSEHIDLDAAYEMGVEKYARVYREVFARVRYFNKRRDWAGEREYRLVYLLDDNAEPPSLVPIEEALVRVVLGHRFPHELVPNIRALCAKVNVPVNRLLYEPFPVLTDPEARTITR